jgi:Zn-dependent protease
MALEFIFQIAVLIMSVVIHEVAHGLAARYYGDHTAEYEGRLTLNPVKHLDPIGSLLVPFILFLTNAGVVFGWAKPVPYNPYNLRPGRWPEAAVAAAGPASNLVLAAIFAICFRLGLASGFSPAYLHITALIVSINLLLMIFNLMPIPPLDGSKLLFAIFPENIYRLRNFFERYGLILVLAFIFFAWQFISPVVGILLRFFLGV